MMNSYIHKVFGVLLILLFPIFYILNSAGITIYKIAMPLTLFLIFVCLFIYRKVQVMMILVIYIAMYFIYMIPFFYFGIQLSQYSLYNNIHYFEKVVLMFYIFYSALIVSSKLKINNQKMKTTEILILNYSFYEKFFLILCSSILVLLTFRQGTNIYRASNYYEAYTENLQVIGSSCLFGVIPLLLLGYSYRDIKKRFFIITPFILLFGIFAITRGTRMVLVPYVILVFILCFDLKFKSIHIVGMCFLGFIVLLVLNMIKAKIAFKASNLFGTGSEYLISHHTDMDYICCAIFGLFDDNKISTWLRFTTRIGTIFEVIIPPKFLPNNWKYPHAIASLMPNGGGCPMFIVLYISFFGYLGIFLLGVILNKLVSLIYDKNLGTGIKLLILSVFIFLSRWISYDFHVILRFPIFAVFFYYCLKIANLKKILKNKNK